MDKLTFPKRLRKKDMTCFIVRCPNCGKKQQTQLFKFKCPDCDKEFLTKENFVGKTI